MHFNWFPVNKTNESWIELKYFRLKFYVEKGFKKKMLGSNSKKKCFKQYYNLYNGKRFSFYKIIPSMQSTDYPRSFRGN